MKTIILLLLTVLLLPACYGQIIVRPMCRHYANITSSAAGEKGPVRIVRGRMYNGTDDDYHVQCQFYEDGKWHWIELDEFGNVITTARDDFYPFKYWSDEKQEMVFDYQYFTPQEYYKRTFARLLNEDDIIRSK